MRCIAENKTVGLPTAWVQLHLTWKARGQRHKTWQAAVHVSGSIRHTRGGKCVRMVPPAEGATAEAKLPASDSHGDNCSGGPWEQRVSWCSGAAWLGSGS